MWMWWDVVVVVVVVRYLFCCSYFHNVAPKGKYIAFVLTEAETDNPEAELKPGVELLAPVDEIFYETYDRYKPTNDPDSEHCYISMVLFSITTISSFQSHFSYIHTCVAELWSIHTLWVHCRRCVGYVHQDNWKGTTNTTSSNTHHKLILTSLMWSCLGSWFVSGPECSQCWWTMRPDSRVVELSSIYLIREDLVTSTASCWAESFKFNCFNSFCIFYYLLIRTYLLFLLKLKLQLQLQLQLLCIIQYRQPWMEIGFQLKILFFFYYFCWS